MARAVLTVDLRAVRANWRALAARAAPAGCAAVVKADAYGLGAAPTARALAAEGARVFFVAMVHEGAALREALGPRPLIYVFNGMDAGEAADVLAHDLRPCLNDPGQIAAARIAAAGAGRRLPVALQLDTGMNRLGLEPAELAALLGQPDGLAGLEVALVLSHLACADDPAHPMNAAQRDAFLTMTAHPRLSGAARSLSATGGTLLGAGFAFDLVRPGIGLYGGLPFADAAPAVALDVPVIQVRDVAAGERVGYGGDWAAARPSRVATLAAGYADGLIRAMGGRARAYRGPWALPVIGRVSMDLLTVDATDAPDLAPGERLSLLGPGQGVDALAAAAGTIGYEILTSLGTRYLRRYEGG